MLPLFLNTSWPSSELLLILLLAWCLVVESWALLLITSEGRFRTVCSTCWSDWPDLPHLLLLSIVVACGDWRTGRPCSALRRLHIQLLDVFELLAASGVAVVSDILNVVILLLSRLLSSFEYCDVLRALNVVLLRSIIGSFLHWCLLGLRGQIRYRILSQLLMVLLACRQTSTAIHRLLLLWLLLIGVEDGYELIELLVRGDSRHLVWQPEVFWTGQAVRGKLLRLRRIFHAWFGWNGAKVGVRRLLLILVAHDQDLNFTSQNILALIVLGQLGNWSTDCCSGCLLRLCDLLPLLLLVRHDYLRLGNGGRIGHNERLTAVFLHRRGSPGAMRLRPGWGLPTALALLMLMMVMMLANAFALLHLLKLLWLDPYQFVLILLLSVLALNAFANWYVSRCLHLGEGQLVHYFVDGCFRLWDSAILLGLGLGLLHLVVWCLLELNTIRPHCELIHSTWLLLLLLWNNLRVSNSELLVRSCGATHRLIVFVGVSRDCRRWIAIQHLLNIN